MSALADSLFILADDLSGAADCAMGAAKTGLKSIVLFNPAIAEQAQVIAIDADCRYRPAAEAGAINVALWQAQATPERLFYKKIDSTLRGNFAAEMAALTRAGVAIVAPAFPATGRTTQNGRVFVKGVPLEQTEIWVNESITGQADIVTMLRSAGISATNITLAGVRNKLRDEISRLVAGKTVQAIVCDAEEEADLAAIAAASVGLPVYWVGSAGLATHLPQAAGLVGKAASPRLAVSGPIVTVVGSLSAVSRQQAQVLESNADLTVFVPTPVLLRTGETHPLWQSLRDQIGEALSAGRDVMIRTGLEEHNDLTYGHALCESLGSLVLPLAPAIGALIATGGETARALLPTFGTHALQLIKEIEPGVPLSLALGKQQIPVITKAGAFGSPAALLKSYSELARIRSGNVAA